MNLEFEVPETDTNTSKHYTYGSYNKAFRSCQGQPVLLRQLRNYHESRSIDISPNPPNLRKWMRNHASRCARVAAWTGNGLVVMAAYRDALKDLNKLRGSL